MIVQTNVFQILPELFKNQFDTVCLHYGYTLNTCMKEFCSNKIIIDKRVRKYQNDIQIGHKILQGSYLLNKRLLHLKILV